MTRYLARSASDKTEDWPFWFVADRDRGGLNVTGDLLRKCVVGYREGQVLTDQRGARVLAGMANRDHISIGASRRPSLTMENEMDDQNTIKSESDDRTANNAVRHSYRVLSDAEKQQMLDLKDIGAAFIAKCNEVGKSREMSLAVTNAEQAVMWAVKHVTA